MQNGGNVTDNKCCLLLYMFNPDDPGLVDREDLNTRLQKLCVDDLIYR